MTTRLQMDGTSYVVTPSSINDDDIYVYHPEDDVIYEQIGRSTRSYEWWRRAMNNKDTGDLALGCVLIKGMQLKHLIPEQVA